VVVLAEHGRRAGQEVVVVTADRGLRRRVHAVGGRCEGPSWLLERVDQAGVSRPAGPGRPGSRPGASAGP
jgi:hypothetical protein